MRPDARRGDRAASGRSTVLDRPDPSAPGPGEVVVAPEAVGICGSDYHFFLGELSDAAGRIAVPARPGPRGRRHDRGRRASTAATELAVGQRVAVWPLRACGQCYPCSVGRPNTCDNFELIGIHLDGGLQQELLHARQEQVFPIEAARRAAVAALAEPVSIAVRAVQRGADRTGGERVVVLGAGPIGQCICLGRARAGRGGAGGRSPGAPPGAGPRRSVRRRCVWTDAPTRWSRRRARLGRRRRSAGRVRRDRRRRPRSGAMIEMVASAGRAVQVGMSNERGPGASRQPDREGARPAGGQLLRQRRVRRGGEAGGGAIRPRSRGSSATSSRSNARPRRCGSRSTIRPR